MAYTTPSQEVRVKGTIGTYISSRRHSLCKWPPSQTKTHPTTPTSPSYLLEPIEHLPTLDWLTQSLKKMVLP
jgi:hypothetical protein